MNSKKIFLAGALFLLVFLAFMPKLASAWSVGDPIVPSCGPVCTSSGTTTTCTGSPCGVCDFFQLITNLYSFIVFEVATPLAVIALAVGGIFMLISAGNANLLGTGKKILYAAIIGLVLVFCSYIIISFIMTVLGYQQGDWWSLNVTC